MIRPAALLALLVLAACEAAVLPAGGGADGPATAAPGAMGPLLNAFRASRGVGPAVPDAALMRAAQAHADDMAAKGTFSHTGSDGSSPGARARAAGCAWGAAAENIAQGQGTPAEAAGWWEGSPAHRANMLDARYDRFGYGRAGELHVLLVADRC